MDTWKRLLFPPRATVFHAAKEEDGFVFAPQGDEAKRRVLFGVTACDQAGLVVLDRVFLEYSPQPDYAAARRNALVVALNCTHAAETAFCRAMGTGPRAGSGCDVVLTEVAQDRDHYLLAEAQSEPGERLLAGAPGREATGEEKRRARACVERTAQSLEEPLDQESLKRLLELAEDPCWESLSRRCLSCGNCTMVCPTCFCHTFHDRADPQERRWERERLWDSCHTADFSYAHGRPVRERPLSRFRHRVTHKLATWHEQFGRSGCVGCGRCIVWCPVGINLRAQIEILLETVASGEKA